MSPTTSNDRGFWHHPIWENFFKGCTGKGRRACVDLDEQIHFLRIFSSWRKIPSKTSHQTWMVVNSKTEHLGIWGVKKCHVLLRIENTSTHHWTTNLTVFLGQDQYKKDSPKSHNVVFGSDPGPCLIGITISSPACCKATSWWVWWWLIVTISLPTTNISPEKGVLPEKKEMNHLPTIHFQMLLLFYSFRGRVNHHSSSSLVAYLIHLPSNRGETLL